MELKITVASRVKLFNLLPEVGTVSNMRTVRALKESLSFTDEENEAHGIKTVAFVNPMTRRREVQTVWTPDQSGKDPETILQLSDRGREYLSTLLQGLEKKEQLPEQLLDVYDQVVPKKD